MAWLVLVDKCTVNGLIICCNAASSYVSQDLLLFLQLCTVEFLASLSQKFVALQTNGSAQRWTPNSPDLTEIPRPSPPSPIVPVKTVSEMFKLCYFVFKLVSPSSHWR